MLDADSPHLGIQIIGVNEVGHESGNDLMTSGRDLPWLQDVDLNNDGQSDVWDDQWGVEFRDVIVVDADNTRLGAFNVTSHNLADPANFEILKDTVVQIAENNPIWQNDVERMDVNNDSSISPVGDVLTCINELNNHIVSDALGNLPVPAVPTPPPYLDVNGDYLISPVGDVLPLINYLNSLPASEGEEKGEGEGSSLAVSLPSAPEAGTSQIETQLLATSESVPLVLTTLNSADWTRSPTEHEVSSGREASAESTTHQGDELEGLLQSLAEDLDTVWN